MIRYGRMMVCARVLGSQSRALATIPQLMFRQGHNRSQPFLASSGVSMRFVASTASDDPTLAALKLTWADVRAHLQSSLSDVAENEANNFKALQRTRAYLKETDVVATFQAVEEAMECLHFLQRLGFPQKSIIETHIINWITAHCDFGAADVMLACRFGEAASAGGSDASGIELWVRLLVHDAAKDRVVGTIGTLSLPELTLLLRTLNVAGGLPVAATTGYAQAASRAAECLRRVLQEASLKQIAAAWYHGGSTHTRAGLEEAALRCLEAPNASVPHGDLVDLLVAINNSTKAMGPRLLGAVVATVNKDLAPSKSDTTLAAAHSQEALTQRVERVASLLQHLAPHFVGTVPALVVNTIDSIAASAAHLPDAALSRIVLVADQLGVANPALQAECRERASRIELLQDASLPRASDVVNAAADATSGNAAQSDALESFALFVRTLSGVKDRGSVAKLISQLQPAHLKAASAEALGNIAEGCSGSNMYPRNLVEAIAQRALEVRSTFAVHQASIVLYVVSQSGVGEALRNEVFTQLLSRIISATKFELRDNRRIGYAAALAGASSTVAVTSQDVALLLRAVEAARFRVDVGSKIHSFLISSATTVMTSFDTKELVSLLLVAHNLRLGVSSALTKGLIQQLKRHVASMSARDAVECVEAFFLTDTRDLEGVQIMTRQFTVGKDGATVEHYCRLAHALMRLKFRSVWEASGLVAAVLSLPPPALAANTDGGLLAYLAPPDKCAEAVVHILSGAPVESMPTRSLLYLFASCSSSAALAQQLLGEMRRRLGEHKEKLERDALVVRPTPGAPNPISRVVPLSVVAKDLMGDAPLPPCIVGRLLAVFIDALIPSCLTPSTAPPQPHAPPAAKKGGGAKSKATSPIATLPLPTAPLAALQQQLVQDICTVEELAASAFEQLAAADAKAVFDQLAVIIGSAGVPFGVFRQLGKPLAELSVSLTGEESARILGVYLSVKIRDDRVLRALFAQCHVHRSVITANAELTGIVRDAIHEYGGHWAGPLAKVIAAAGKGSTAAAKKKKDKN